MHISVILQFPDFVYIFVHNNSFRFLGSGAGVTGLELRELAAEVRALRGAGLLQQNRGVRRRDQTQLKGLPVIQLRVDWDFHPSNLRQNRRGGRMRQGILRHGDGNIKVSSVWGTESEVPLLGLDDRGATIHRKRLVIGHRLHRGRDLWDLWDLCLWFGQVHGKDSSRNFFRHCLWFLWFLWFLELGIEPAPLRPSCSCWSSWGSKSRKSRKSRKLRKLRLRRLRCGCGGSFSGGSTGSTGSTSHEAHGSVGEGVFGVGVSCVRPGATGGQHGTCHQVRPSAQISSAWVQIWSYHDHIIYIHTDRHIDIVKIVTSFLLICDSISEIYRKSQHITTLDHFLSTLSGYVGIQNIQEMYAIQPIRKPYT